jgi:hypothetical protein
MKYLKIILIIILLVSGISFIVYISKPASNGDDVVMTVNKHTVTSEMVSDDEGKQNGWHDDSRADTLNSLAIRQLLIEEAQRQRIDREPAFRKAIKNFYEQTLINILAERKEKENQVEVSAEEVARFREAFGKTYTFLISEHHSGDPNWEGADTISQPFSNLSSTLQAVLAVLQVGEFRQVYDTGNQNYWIKLEKISGDSDPGQAVPKEMAQKIIAASKQEQQMDIWVDELLQKADITYHDKEGAE